jgi:NAD(P)-dependent dehydrogenase (short-subunit alcohol dehydrogenase family)
MRLKSRVAIVTGAASGIGQEIARTFAREGARVAIVDINAEGAQRAAAQIIDEGGQAMAVALDVTHESQVIEGIGAPYGVRANVICPGFVRTPLVERQIPEQAHALGISEQEVIRNVMLKETVDGEFTTLRDVAEAAVFFAAFESNALTGQSLVVSHGWSMQ